MSFKKLFDRKIEVVNIGLDSFRDDLEKQGEKVVNVEWTPPANIDDDVLQILQKNKTIIKKANEKALEIILNGKPYLVGKILTENDGANIGERIRNFNSSGFEVHTEEAYNLNYNHGNEQFGYIVLGNESIYGIEYKEQPSISLGSEEKISEYQEELPYYIESGCNTTDTRIWVQIPVLPENGQTTIYMYYNNSQASDEGNLKDVFTYSNLKPIFYPVGSNNADNADVISFIDSNEIRAGSATLSLNENETGVISNANLNQNTPVSILGPVQIESQSTGDAFAPISFASKEFVYRAYDGTDTFYYYAPFDDADVELCYGVNFATCLNNVTVQQGQINYHGDVPNNNAIRITSTTPILAFHQSGGSRNYVLYPAATDWWGVASNYLHIAAMHNSTNVTVYWSDGTTSNSIMNAGDQWSLSGGTGNQGADRAAHVVANDTVGCTQMADSDGGDGTTFLPEWELEKEYYIPQDLQYITIATTQPNTECIIYNSTNDVVFQQVSGSLSSPYPNKLLYTNSTPNEKLPAGSRLVCNASVYAYYEYFTNDDEHNVWSIKANRQYQYPAPNYTIDYSAEEDKYGGLINTGNTNITGYLWMAVEKNTESGWETSYPVVVNDRATSTLRTVEAGQTLNLSQIWNDAGGWYTDEKEPGNYRVYIAFEDPNGNVLIAYTGPLNNTYNFKIINVTLELTNLEHENEYEHAINEYEVGDKIDWINVTVAAINNTALDANITLNLLDQNQGMVGWGPNETKLCGNIPEGQTCEKKWDNSSAGYPIPLSASSGTYTFYWNVTMLTFNGPVQFNKSLSFKIHNIPSTFSSILSPSRLYKPAWGWYNFTFKNLWSKNLTNVKVKINCPSVPGFECNCALNGQSGEICDLGDVMNGTSVTVPFNVSVSDSTPIGDFYINITLNYTNPGSETKSWKEYENQILEVRSPELLEIYVVKIPSNVTRGGNYEISSYINNTASFTSHKVWLNYTLPSGWINASGELNKYNETLCPSCILWNNITANVGINSNLGKNYVKLYSGSAEGQEDWKSVIVYVYANTSLINFEASEDSPNRGETITLSAKLIYDNGSAIVGENVTFYDETTDEMLGSDLTDNNGIASISWLIPDDYPLGQHSLNVTYKGSQTKFTNPSFNKTTITIGAFPTITSVKAYPSPVGYGYNVTIEANVTDEDGVSTVFAKVWYPNGSVSWIQMTNYSTSLYKTNFTDTWQYGVYNFTIWANDTKGNEFESEKYSFEVKVSAEVEVVTDNSSYLPNTNVYLIPFEGNWWRAGWKYRKPITLTNSLGNDLTNYVMLLDVDTISLISAGKMNEDCSDIRFVDSDNKTELPYWIESGCNSADTKIWVKVNLTASSSKVIWMYYGNVTPVESRSNVSEVMGFVEFGKVNVENENYKTVYLNHSFKHPIVVASPEYPHGPNAPPYPMGVIIRNVTKNSFEVKVDRPQGSLSGTITTVHFVVMEIGSWYLLNSSTLIQGGEVKTTKDAFYSGSAYFGSPDNAEVVEFPTPFPSTPTILHTRTTENNNLWAVTYVGAAGDRTSIPNTTHMDISLLSGQLGDQNFVQNETLHWIGITSGSSGEYNGIKWSAENSQDIVRGFTNSPYFWSTPFTQTYENTPEVIVAGKIKEDGGNGGWAVLSQGDSNQTHWASFIDEVEETDRSHTTEVVSAISFSTSGFIPIRKYADEIPSVEVGEEEKIGKEIPTQESVPLYTIDQQPQQCSGMNYGDSCEVSWRVNLTGNVGTLWKIFVESESSDSRIKKNVSKFGVVKIVDLTPPKWYELGSSNSTPMPGDYVKFYAYWKDNYNLSLWKFEWNATLDGSWKNESSGEFYGKENWSNITIEIPGVAAGKTIGYRFYAFDTSNNQNLTKVGTINVQQPPDTEAPLINDFWVSPKVNGYGANFTIKANVSDNVAVYMVKAYITYPNGSSTSIILEKENGDIYSGIFREGWQSGNYSFYVWANDTANNQNDTSNSPKSFNVSANVTIKVETEKDVYGPNQYVKLSESSNWWNKTFRFRRGINITNPNSYDLENYQVNFSIDTSSLIDEGKMNEDCSDIRFTYLNRSTNTEIEIPYYIDGECDVSGETKIWVKVPFIQGGGYERIYLYYGNLTPVESESDIEEVFSYSEPRTIGYVVSDQIASNGISILSLCDNNEVQVGTNTYTLDEMESVTVSGISKDTEIKVKCLAQIEGAGTKDDIIVPISWAGREFIYDGFRDSSDTFCMLSPFGTANVKIYVNGILQWSGTVDSSGTCMNFDVLDETGLRIISDIPILVAYYGAGGNDAYSFYPATTEKLYGIPSNYFIVAAGPNGATISYTRSDTGATSTTTISPNDDYRLSGLGSDGNAPAFVVEGSDPIGAIQQADSDGTESTTFLPSKELTTKFGSARGNQYVAIATPYQDTECTIYSGASPLSTQSASGSNGIYKICFNCGSDSTYISGAWKVECTKPVYAYYEEDSTTEETNVLGYKQMRQYAWPEPEVVIGSEEENSFIFNNGTTNFKAYLLMSIEKLENGNWEPVKVVINESYAREIESNKPLEISSIWNSEGWNTNNYDNGTYRIKVELNDPKGNILKDATGNQMIATYEFSLLVNKINISVNVSTSTGQPALIKIYDRNWNLEREGYQTLQENVEPNSLHNLKIISYLSTGNLETTIYSANITKGINITSQIVENYSGYLPSKISKISPIYAMKGIEIPYERVELIIPKGNVKADYILHCTQWDFDSKNCTSWIVNRTEEYGMDQNSTHVWFNVTEFDAYAVGSGGLLTVELISPPNNSIVPQYRNFTIKANITCFNADCGTIYGYALYNSSSPNPDTNISTSKGDVPFYTFDPNPQTCTLLVNESCVLEWKVNSTGELNSFYRIGVYAKNGIGNFSSNHTIEIGKIVIVNLTWEVIDFGICDPKTYGNPAVLNDVSGYNITVDPNSNDIDGIYIKGDDLLPENVQGFGSIQYFIEVSNVTWNSEENDYTSSYTKRLSKAYELIESNVPSGSVITMFYWIDIPPGEYAQKYSGKLYILSNISWEP